MSEDVTTQAPEGTTAPDTTKTEPWYGSFALPAEDVGYIQNKKWDSPVAMLKSYQNLETFRGVPEDRLLTLPKDAADQEAWAKIYTKLGRPEKVEDYGEFKTPEGINQELDPNRAKWADNVFHKLGLNKQQRDALMSETMKFEGTLHDAYNKDLQVKQDAELVELKKEWGQHYGEREELGRRAVRTFLPGDEASRGDLLDKIEKSIGTGAMLKLFANIGEKLGEDKSASANAAERSFGYTKEQAAADKQGLMQQIQSDPARLTQYNMGKGEDYEKMRRLLSIIAS